MSSSTRVLVAGLVALAGSAASGQVFQRVIGSEINERAWDVERLSDGYITVGHVRTGPFGEEDIYVCRYDDDGTLVWDQILGGQGRDIGFSIARDGADGFIVAAETTSVAAGRELALIRLAGDGSVVWARVYNGEFQSDPLHPLDGVEVERVSDGGFVAAHHYRGDPTLLRVRDDGSMVFHRSYVVGATNNEGLPQRIAFTDLKVDAGEPGIIVSGTREVNLPGADVQQDFLLSRFTPAGDPVYMRAFDTFSLKDPGHWVNEKGCGIDFAIGSTGEILISGVTDFGVPGQFGLQIIRADLAGVPLDVKTYDVSPGLAVTGRGLIPGYASIRADRPGDAGLAGTLVDTGAGITHAALLNVDSFTLAPLSLNRYRPDSDGQATVPARDTCGYAVAGATVFEAPGYGGFDTYLVKTDDAGETFCESRNVDHQVRTPGVFCDHYDPQWFAHDNVLNWDIRSQRRGAKDEALCFYPLCEPCPPDLDFDGDADADDFFLYLDSFASLDPRADMDSDGDVDSDDFFEYLDLFARGC